MKVGISNECLPEVWATGNFRASLEEPHYLSVNIINSLCRWPFRKTGHGHDTSADYDDELGTGGESYLPNVNGVITWCPTKVSIG